jgi:hypothetical protein
MRQLDLKTAKALQDQAVRKRLVGAGLDPTYVDHTAFFELIRAKESCDDEIIKRTGIRAEH